MRDQLHAELKLHTILEHLMEITCLQHSIRSWLLTYPPIWSEISSATLTSSRTVTLFRNILCLLFTYFIQITSLSVCLSLPYDLFVFCLTFLLVFITSFPFSNYIYMFHLLSFSPLKRIEICNSVFSHDSGKQKRVY
jgi:hypothetical protein